ncbi:hypothetical protein [Erwinia amylovora]
MAQYPAHPRSGSFAFHVFDAFLQAELFRYIMSRFFAGGAGDCCLLYTSRCV